MEGVTFWQRVVKDKANFLGDLLDLLHEAAIDYAVIGGQAVNAYVEPLVSLDLDLVIAVAHWPRAEALLREHFTVEAFPYRLNIARADSQLRVQIQTDPRYFEFVPRASVRPVLDVPMPVAAVADVLQGKIWAVQDPARRPSKRRKDLLDIERLLDAYPTLRPQVPAAVLHQLE